MSSDPTRRTPAAPSTSSRARWPVSTAGAFGQVLPERTMSKRSAAPTGWVMPGMPRLGGRSRRPRPEVVEAAVATAAGAGGAGALDPVEPDSAAGLSCRAVQAQLPSHNRGGGQHGRWRVEHRRRCRSGPLACVGRGRSVRRISVAPAARTGQYALRWREWVWCSVRGELRSCFPTGTGRGLRIVQGACA
jgi:hypothetical protein